MKISSNRPKTGISSLEEIHDTNLLHEAKINREQYSFGSVLTQTYQDTSWTMKDYTMNITRDNTRITFMLPVYKPVILFNFSQELAIITANLQLVPLSARDFILALLPEGEQTLMLNKGFQKILLVELHENILNAFSSTYRILDLIGKSMKEKGLHVLKVYKSILTSHLEESYASMLKSDLKGESWNILRETMLSKLIIDSLIQLNNMQETTSQDITTEDKKFLDIKTFILHNLDKKLDLHKISGKFQILPDTLRKGFKRAYGYNLLSFIRKERMLKAVRLLKETDLAIQEIAWEVGYESPTAFSRIFSAFHGTPPNDFRIKEKK